MVPSMSLAQHSPMTLAEFLEWEERQELRYEFDGFAPVAMTGGTIAHDRITFNIQRALASRLAGSPCQPFGPNVKIVTPGKARYPDAVVTCSPVDQAATVVAAPVVVFEVISDDTARTDRIEKLREYQATVSIQRYVIVEQKSAGAMAIARKGEDWVVIALTEVDTLRLPEIGIEIPLSEFYAGLDLTLAEASALR
jgi:Uma2 family endonuclease